MKTATIPQTDSITELATFWSTHDLTDFEDELEEVTETVFEREDRTASRVVIHMRDKEKTKLLVELLSALDFVDSIEVTEAPMEREGSNGHTRDDFFALAGIWQDRDISQDTLRSKAWPQQEP